MARTTADRVREELDVSKEDYPSIEDTNWSSETILDAWIQRAHTLVENRLPNETDEELLTEIETLIAAHFAVPRITGATAGKDVSRVSEGSATLAYETTEFGPDGVESPFWAQAVELAPGLETSGTASFEAL